MNRLIFEGRFLVNMVGGIIRQEDLRVRHSRIDWERMYRIADYHKIANMVYLGLLGNGEAVPGRWQEHFFKRYQESLFYGEVSVEAEREVLMLFDMMKIPCTVLTSSRIWELYQIPEMSANNPLRLMLDEESFVLAKGYLVDLGYETERTYKGCGERMKHGNGFCVELYYRLPFRTRPYEKNMQRILESAFLRGSSNYVRTLSLDNRYIFMAAWAVYHYAEDELLIREVLDLYLYHRMWREEMNREYIQKTLDSFQIDAIAEKILQISYMWFGVKEEILPEGQTEDMKAYDVLENRILSQGSISTETDQQALHLASCIKREIEKEKRRDKLELWKERFGKVFSRFMRRLRWLFPEYKYMCAIYPFLETLPVLLPFYWIRRGVRLLISIFSESRK